LIKSSDQRRRTDTRGQIVDAALEALRTVGFGGATSRAIARIGGFNQALVFYHFGSLDRLLLAALDKTSSERLQVYRKAVEGIDSLDELAPIAAALYREDRDSGHMTVVSQMFAGSLTRPELAPALVERMEPWIDLAEESITKALARTPIGAAVPARDLAYAVVTFYVGVNLLTHLDPDRARTDALFERLTDAGPLLSALTRA
jgi:AcrR family transcriptional regulator